MVDLPGISNFQAHIGSGGIPLGSFFDLLGLAMIITIFLFVVSGIFCHD
jgi:hypothetical protein